MRYELKMTFDVTLTHVMIHKLLSNSLGFKEIYHERQVNNVYFDTLGFDDLQANIDGLYNRSKFRMRWYGTEDKFYPVLEEKIKHGQLGTKKIDNFDDLIDLSTLLDNYHSIGLNDLHQELRFKQRHPVIINSYLRRYFMSADNKIRVTLDMNIKYSHIKSPNTQIENNSIAILELKFEEEDYHQVQSLIQTMGFRFDKNSKYVEGMSLTNYI